LQTVVQLPQCRSSVSVSTQALPHSAKPVSHIRLHVPLAQRGVPFIAAAHCVVQFPQ